MGIEFLSGFNMGTNVTLDRVCLDLPIYGISSLSLKKRLMNFRWGNAENYHDSVVTIRALSNITLSLKPGDSLGLIGRNGAGKSSLLRVLAGIYNPTSGFVSISGLTVPLLDIGLGLDEQSTGRQNIRLRSLLLGMSNKEILDKTESIIDFSELSDYIDLPIRTYSTGMRVRLAFAIATAVDADILILDEVLGVGDAGFQGKAKSRLRELHSRAQIIVHAIHDEATIRESCNKALWLDKGQIKIFGDAEEVYNEYKKFIE